MDAETGLDASDKVSAAPEPAKPAKKKTISGVLGQIGLDMIPVIAGILVALFINNLQEERRDRKLLESTLQSFTEEFKKNTENINTFFPRQERFLDTLQYYKEDSIYSIYDISMKANGMGTPDLYSTNWRTSLNNNSLSLLNFRTINLLSAIDAKYQELWEQESMLVSTTLGPSMFKTGEEGFAYRKGLELWVNTYMGNERELLVLYEKFNKIVKEKQYHRN